LVPSRTSPNEEFSLPSTIVDSCRLDGSYGDLKPVTWRKEGAELALYVVGGQESGEPRLRAARVRYCGTLWSVACRQLRGRTVGFSGGGN
jgi:hypothetical protein